MRYDSDKIQDALWLGGVLILVVVILFLLSAINSESANAGTTGTKPAYFSQVSDSPNSVTRGMASTINGFGNISRDFVTSVEDGANGIGSSVAGAGSTVGNGVSTAASATARGVTAGAKTTVSGIGSGLSFVGSAAAKGCSAVGSGISSVASSSLIGSIVRPEDTTEIPVIDPNSPELYAAINALPSNTDAQDGPVWPIRGRVTTEFGVPHRPWQKTHTGIDISDSKPSGTTAIKPFRSGTVISIVHSRRGLGNHVIIDHGSGVTSVYAHMSSISVKQGEKADLNTILGYEGSTGASTGTHLHFEVRVNGQAADPRKFISGKP